MGDVSELVCRNNDAEALLPGELPNKSVENRGVVCFGLAVNFVDPAELLENKSNGKSILGVAFLLTSFSGEVARDD